MRTIEIKFYKMKKIIVLILVSIVLVNCKSKDKKQDFTALTKSYFDDKELICV